jgi:hypothetical protein
LSRYLPALIGQPKCSPSLWPLRTTTRYAAESGNCGGVACGFTARDVQNCALTS